MDSVTIAEGGSPQRVILHARIDNQVIVRLRDPGEPDPPRIPVYTGDTIEVMTAISHFGLHAEEVSDGRSDLIHSMRVVPVRREGNQVFARTLRHGEADDGRRVHVMKGDQLRFEVGAVTAELAAIDAAGEATESGHVPIAPVLSTWIRIDPSNWTEGTVRYVLAAARRLDMANELFIRVREVEAFVNSASLSGPQFRRQLLNVIGLVELAVISLGRSISMIAEGPRTLGVSTPVPQSITDALGPITAIRNDYEHIEDRAFGTRYGKPYETAAAVFDYTRLFSEDLIAHGKNTFNIGDEADLLIADCRETLKAFVANSAGSRSVGVDRDLS